MMTQNQRYVTSVNTNFKKNNNQKLLQSIVTKMSTLLQVTYNLKCAAYKIIKVPVESIKNKIRTDSSSLLTNMDSIFYDLKRVETILQEHSRDYFLSNNIKKNTPQQQDYSFHVQFLTPSTHQLKKNQKPYYSSGENKQFSRKSSKLNIDSRPDLKSTVKVNNLIASPNMENKFITSINNLSNKYLNPNRYQENKSNFRSGQALNKKKSSKQMRISRVSSMQYVGQGNPEIKIKSDIRYQKPQPSMRSSRHSRHSRSQMPVDWEEVQIQQVIKDEENQMFINDVRRQRQNYLSHIKQKQIQCFESLKRLNNKFKVEHEHVPIRTLNSMKRRSMTQKFFKSQYGGNDQLNQARNNMNETLSLHQNI